MSAFLAGITALSNLVMDGLIPFTCGYDRGAPFVVLFPKFGALGEGLAGVESPADDRRPTKVFCGGVLASWPTRPLFEPLLLYLRTKARY